MNHFGCWVRCSVATAVALVAATSAAAPQPPEPSPQDIQAAIEQVRTSTNFAPRAAFRLLELWTPRWPVGSPRARELATQLLEAIRAPDSTALGRTTLAQHLALVAEDPERTLLSDRLTDPTLAEPARIALGGDWPSANPRPPAALEADLAASHPATRLAALAELVSVHPTRAVAACEAALHDPDDTVAVSAIRWLARLDGARLVARLDDLPPARLATALGAFADVRAHVGRTAALARVEAADPGVRAAAIAALGPLGTAEEVPLLARLGAAEALAAIPDPAADAAIADCRTWGSTSQRVACISALATRGAPNLSALLLPLAGDADPVVRATVLKALAQRGERAVLDALMDRLRDDPSPELENALKQLVQRFGDLEVIPRLGRLLDDAAAPLAARAAALRVLPALGHDSALGWIERYSRAGPTDLRDVAIRSLAQSRTPAAVPALLRVRGADDTSPVHRHLANEALARWAPRLVHLTNVLSYLDCGAVPRADGLHGVSISVRRGEPWRWADTPPGTVVFDPREVLIDLDGLSPTGHYEVGLSWWDYDAGGREQSIFVNGEPALPRTPLPRWRGAEQPAAVIRIPIPEAALRRGGPVTLAIRRDAGPNVVVGEVWVCALTHTVSPSRDTTLIEVRANTGATCRVLIVTGEDIPAHAWRETTPRLVAALAADPRLEVSVAETPTVLATPKIESFQAIVLHAQNDRSAPSAAALNNLRRAVSNGCGLVVAHFASGALFDRASNAVWPAYTELVGRTWNPRLRAHDPRGPFTVRIREPAHPVTLGLSDFTTDDELYTCLDGDAPILVLADAVSKVDGRPYPLVFTREFGRGRVFHCALGHDARALATPAVEALYRRGTVWAARRPPAEFQADGHAFSFDTGELRGRLHNGGRPTGLAPLLDARTGRDLAQRHGVLSIYRLLEPHRRHPDGWSRADTTRRLRPDGSVETIWPATETTPFELRAIWRWASANAVDISIHVEARAPLRAFEVFCASYFAGFERAFACVRAPEGPAWRPADPAEGVWQAFPRDEAAATWLRDGRWQIPPHPVEWAIQPAFALPAGLRLDSASGRAAFIIGRASDCFAVLMPQDEEPHRSLYLSLFGRDLAPGERASSAIRLLIASDIPAPPPVSWLEPLGPAPAVGD